MDKLKIRQFKILSRVLGILVFVGAIFGVYKLGQKQAPPVPQSTPTPAVTCGSCPQFVPPHPDFCKDGTIIPSKVDECGCRMPPTCQRPTPTVEGRFCGGIAGNLPENQCPPGYRCQLEGNYPDAGGKCVRD